MKYVVDHIPDKEICAFTVTGEVKRPEDMIELQGLSWSYARQNSCCKFIFDLREATVIGGESAVHEVAAAPSVMGIDPDNFHVALVFSGIDSETQAMQYLLEKRGFDYQAFTSIDAAYLWIEQR